MLEVLSSALASLFRLPATRRYPKVKKEAAGRFRGKHIWHRDKCVHCKMCERVCPTGACTYSDKKKKPVFDLSLCIFCGECGYKCPPKAIEFSGEFALASRTKKSLFANP